MWWFLFFCVFVGKRGGGWWGGGGGGGGHMRVVGLFHELIRPRGERARMFFKKQNTGTI